MESMGKSYLVFIADGLYFLLPLAEVEQIRDGSREEGREYIDFSGVIGGSACIEKGGYKYIILLKKRQVEGDAGRRKEDSVENIPEETGILVESIFGIIEIEALQEFTLKSPVINSRNRFLKSVVKIQAEEVEAFAYLLDVGSLFELAQEDYCEENETEKEDCKENWLSGTDVKETVGDSYISLLLDSRTLYIDKDEVIAVVMRPEIKSVPRASRGVLGISFYKGDIVVYYNPLDNGADNQTEKQDEKMQCGLSCGVIIKTYGGKLAGIAGDKIEEADVNIEDKEAVVSLWNGIWEKKCD